MGISGRLNWSDPRLLIITRFPEKEISALIARNQSGSRFRATGRRFVDYNEGRVYEGCVPRPSASCSNGSPRRKTSQTPSKSVEPCICELTLTVESVICCLFVQRYTWSRILHLIHSATRHFCSLFVQQMRSCPSAESVHQTQVFSVLLAFPSLVNGWTIASAGAEMNALKRTKFLQFNRAPHEGVTC